MPTYELTGPDGGTYELEAPDEAAAMAAFSQFGGAKPAPAEPSLLSKAIAVPMDTAGSVAGGLVRGAAQVAGLPRLGVQLAEAGMGWGINKAAGALGLETNSMRGVDTSSGIAETLPTAEQVLGPVEKVLPKPTTRAGRYAQTGGEFAAGLLAAPSTYGLKGALTMRNFVRGGGEAGEAALNPISEIAKGAGSRSDLARNLALQGAAPAVASEAAGQATEGTAAEPWARGGAALGVGIAGGLASGPAFYERWASRSARGATPEQFDAAQSLKAEFPWLTNAEALQQATGGTTQMGRLQRITESTEGGGALLDPMMARRPAQMQAASEGALDGIAQRNPYPTQLGQDVQAASRGAVLATPEGEALRGALAATGPETTAGMAGGVIQPALRGRRDGFEAVRKLQADRDYGAARRDSPESFGQERTIQVERPGEPIVTTTYPEQSPRFERDVPEPLPPILRGDAAVEAGPGPESLGRFIARSGGLQLDGDLKSAGLHEFKIPGYPKPVREGGKSLDGFWRTKLKEAGYLPRDADGYTTEDIRRVLQDKLVEEQRGRPSYPIGSEARVKGVLGAEADQLREAMGQAEGFLDDALRRVDISPASIGPEVRERTLAVLVREPRTDPLEAYERVVRGQKEPYGPFTKTTPTTVAEEIPAPRFGQVNAERPLAAVDAQLEYAKDDVARALQSVRKDLFGQEINPQTGAPELDLSVEGLLKARERLDMRLKTAIEDGDGTKIRDLTIVRKELDGALKEQPLVAKADDGFAGNSVPLERFERSGAPLGRITDRIDPKDPQSVMRVPAEQVPEALSTRSAMEEFNGIPGLSQAARSAMDDYLTTRGLNASRGSMQGPDPYFVNADRLRGNLRSEADLMSQAPVPRDRLSRVVEAREGLAPVEALPIGQAAETPRTSRQLAILMGEKVSPTEAGEAVGAVARQNGPAARQLVREKGGQMADRTVNDLDARGRPDQAGGAKMAKEFFGPGEGARFRAAIEAAAGRPVAERTARVMEALQATGWREGKGSLTAFNAQDLKDMERGIVGTIVQGITKPMSSMSERAGRVMLGRQSEKLAELLSSPDGLARIRALGEKPSRADLLTLLTAQGASGGQGETLPLRLSVRPQL